MFGAIALHFAAKSGNVESLKFILSLYPESDLFRIVCLTDCYEQTVLHHAGESDGEIVKYIMSLLSESQRFQIVKMKDMCGSTLLHRAAA